MSTKHLASSAGPFLGAVGATVTALVAGWLWLRTSATEEEDEDVLIIYTSADGGQGSGAQQQEASKHCKTRSNGIKVSRLTRMLEELSGASNRHMADPYSQPSAIIVSNDEKEEIKPESFNELTWEEQIRHERRVLEAAARLLRDVRESSVHKKLPHFHAVDRQLQVLEGALEGVAVMVRGFWRYGRDEPMAALMDLPLLRLAACDVKVAGPLVPLSVGVVKEGLAGIGESYGDGDDVEDGDGYGGGGVDGGGGGGGGVKMRKAEGDRGGEEEEADDNGASNKSPEDLASEDLALLGLVTGDREAIESAYRRRSRHFHRHGRCTNIRGFHALTAARNRCVARLMGPAIPAYGLCGGDLLALYLLIGTDPIDNRYGERSLGILDAAHRSQLQTKLQVLHWPSWDIPLTWGDEDDMMTFGGPNHLGASG